MGNSSSRGFGIGIGLEIRPRIDSEPVLERTRLLGAFGAAPLAGAAAFHGLFIVTFGRDCEAKEFV